MKKIRLFGDRILVKRWSLPEQSFGGVYILGRDYPTMGVVLQVGNGKRALHDIECDIIHCPFKSVHPHLYAREGERIDIEDIRAGDIVQWSVGANFDLQQIDEDLFIFNYEDLNFVMRDLRE